MSFFSELKRRRVLRFAGIYIVAAWVTIQAAATIFPALELPAWSVKLVIGIVAVCFPIALGVAWAFDITPEGLQRTSRPDEGDSATVIAVRFRPGRAALFVLGFLVATLGAWILIGRSPTATTSRDVVAIAPFRVSGADPSLAYLREGLVDLLAAKLTGEGGPRSVDPRTMLAAWQQVAASPAADLPQDRAIDVAATVGAGQLLLGDLTGTPARVQINAYVLSSPGGRELARSSVSGPQDSLPQLLDRLTAELLIGESREGEHRTAALTSASLPALRSYLVGRAAYRRGAYQDAAAQFTRALELDSTFALAALMLGEARLWTGQDLTVPLKHAWRHAQRLSRRDSLLLAAWVGPRTPRATTMREEADGFRHAGEAAPDRPEVRFLYGDDLLHVGPLIGQADWQEGALRAFNRVVALDSAFAAPIEHLIDLAGLRGDTAEARRLSQLYFARDSTSDLADYVRWRVASVTGDRTALSELRGRADQIPLLSLIRIIAFIDVTGLNLEDHAVYARARESKEYTADTWSDAFTMFNVASNHGNSEQRRRSLRAIAEFGPSPGLAESILIREVLFSSADSTGAGDALATLSRLIASGGDAAWPTRAAQLEWQMFNGRLDGAPQFIARLARDSATLPGAAEAAILLDAEHAVLARRPDADQRLAAFDSLLLRGPLGLDPGAEVVLARLYELRGNPRRALEVVRRARAFHIVYGLKHLAGSLRVEGRLATAVGDRAGAISAYQRYLALRANAESTADRAELEQVKRDLAGLVNETRR